MSVNADRLLLFGATGDLAQRMLLPSLCALDADGLLEPDLKIVGTARSEMTTREYRDWARAALEKNLPDHRRGGVRPAPRARRPPEGLVRPRAAVRHSGLHRPPRLAPSRVSLVGIDSKIQQFAKLASQLRLVVRHSQVEGFKVSNLHLKVKKLG